MAFKGNKILRSLLLFLPPILFISLSLYLFFYSTPDRIIDWVGISNAYGLMFVLAFLGGLTTFSGVPYYLVLITFASGGLNPFGLAVSAASGVMLGDSTSYYLGYRGQAIVPQVVQNIFKKIYSLNPKYPKILPVFAFVYGAFIPFSNDFITISAGIARYPFWQIMIPLGLGDFVFNLLVAYFATDIYGVFSALFLH